MGYGSLDFDVEGVLLLLGRWDGCISRVHGGLDEKLNSGVAQEPNLKRRIVSFLLPIPVAKLHASQNQ